MPNVNTLAGRNRRTYKQALTVQTTATQILWPSRARVGLLFCGAANIIHLAEDSNISTSNGLVVATGVTLPLVFDVETFGAWVQGNIFAIASVSPTFFTWFVIEDPDIEAQGP